MERLKAVRIGRPKDSLRCPFLRGVAVDWIWLYPTAVYCRPPSGRVRVPSGETVARFCTSGRYAACPGYRRASFGAESEPS